MNLRSKLILPSLTLFLSFLTFFANAQAPLQIPYQGVARDAQGVALQNQLITLRLTIEDATGADLFQEIHQTNTNPFGLFNVQIGSIVPMNIDWGSGTRFLHVEMDPNGGSTYVDLGTTQFLSVPYALYAETSNTPGPQGPAGPQGPQGEQGIQGEVGPQGPAGVNGTNGINGQNGAQGPQGIQGETGPQGPAGANGTNGINGQDGAQGPQGIQGEMGPQGEQGIQGEVGPQGPIGLTGATGATGPQGPAGVNGTNGQSAYEIWLAQGNTGTQQDFLNSLSSSGSSAVSPTTTPNTTGNYSVISGMGLPAFLNYYGNCALGNHVCTNNEIIANNSAYCNLTIPAGVTANVLPAVRTIIYVKDTLFLFGTLNGSGLHTSVSSNNATVNHVGATASSFNNAGCSNGISYGYGSGNASFSLSWTANQAPSTLYSQFDGSISKNPGQMICSDIYNCCSYNGCAQDGQDLFSSDLLTLIHFGSNISGGNGQAMAACSGPSMAIAMGGQGGAGLYIIARCVVFTGEIILNGGNGMAVVGSCNPSYNCSSAGGGGGSCIIRTSQLSQNTGMFSSVGGNSGVCNKKGGNGAMLIVTD